MTRLGEGADVRLRAKNPVYLSVFFECVVSEKWVCVCAIDYLGSSYVWIHEQRARSHNSSVDLGEGVEGVGVCMCMCMRACREEVGGYDAYARETPGLCAIKWEMGVCVSPI